MRYCPVCQTRYDEEIMRFCTKDGTPLIDEEGPNFVEMPSENLELDEEEDFGAETVVRRNSAGSEITNVEPRNEETQQRMVIPTSETARQPEQVGTKQVSYQQPPRRTSTATVVLLTILGTVVVLGGGAGIYWLISGGNGSTVANSNSNLNANQDTNLNTNLGIDNSLFNANSDINANANANANTDESPSPTRTPSPTPSPTRTPTPSPSPTPNEDADNTNSENTNSSGAPVNTRPTSTPTTRPSSSPTSSPVNIGNMNTRAVSLIKPAYPPLARQIRAGGQVPVQIIVDETGRVISAKATDGHPLLRQAAENAARQSRFTPVRVSGQAVKSAGTVVYNFVNN